MKRFTYLMGSILLLNTAIACTPNPPKQAQAPISAKTNVADDVGNAAAKPQTKTVMDPWTQKPIAVNLYQETGVPFTTYVPAQEFVVEQSSADEGLGVWFYSQLPGGKKQAQAYVHVFVPRQPMTVEQMRQDVTGARGLLASNSWQADRRTSETPWSWAKERIDFQGQENPQSVMGTLYLGEHKGQAFRVTIHYPADYGDGFAPRAQVIVDNLAVNP